MDAEAVDCLLLFFGARLLLLLFLLFLAQVPPFFLYNVQSVYTHMQIHTSNLKICE